jgi:hypothetical protein
VIRRYGSAVFTGPGRSIAYREDPLISLNLRGEVLDTLVSIPGGAMYGDYGSYVPLPFTSRTPFTLKGDTIVVAAGPGHGLRFYSRSGQELGSLSIQLPRRPVTERDSELWLNDQLSGYSLDDLPPNSPWREIVFPDSLPGYTKLLASQTRVWARRYVGLEDQTKTWDSFLLSGRWTGSLQVPAEFRITDFDEDHVTCVRTDPLGVESVLVFLLKPGAASDRQEEPDPP